MPPEKMDNTEKPPLDATVIFGGEDDLPPPPHLSEAEEKKLWRKVDLKLLPILTLLYLVSFIDKVNIANARLQGLDTQLNLKGNRFNMALLLTVIPYCIFELPANLVLKKFRPSRWLPGITLLWGIVMTLTGLVKNYHQLLAARVILGTLEAGLYPGVVYYLSIWYPRHLLQFRIGLSFGAASIAGAFSGLLAYAISFLNGTQGLEGWSWIFILEGIMTVGVSIIALGAMVDFPATSNFLTSEERAYVVWRKKHDNSSVGEEEHFEMRHLMSVITDWQIYVHLLVIASVLAPLFGITLFLPTIIHSFGYSPAISQILTIPPYVFAAILIYIFAHFSDKLKMRSPFILAGLTMCLVGFSINISKTPSGVKYFGTFFCVAGSFAAYPGVIAWLSNNLSGQYKRGMGIAIHLGIGILISSIVTINSYRSQDFPRFILGHALELMFVAIGLIVTPLIVLSYIRINRKRDASEKAALEGGNPVKYTARELQMMGDRAPDFRYTL